MTSLRIQLIAIVLCCALLPLLIVGILNINTTTEQLQDSAHELLVNTVEAKEAALEEYLYNAELGAQSMAQTQAVQTFAQLLYEKQNTEPFVADAEDILHSFQETYWGLYHHIYITDVDGQVVLSPPHGTATHAHEEQDISVSPIFARALQETVISGFFGFDEADHYHSVLLSPIKDANGRTLAVIGMELEIGYIAEVLAKNSDLGETGTIFLTTDDGTPVVRNKEDEQGALTTKGILAAQTDNFVTGEFTNAFGEKVFGVYKRHESYPWIVAAEIHLKEVHAHAHEMRNSMIVVIIIAAIIVTLLAVFFSNIITKPIAAITSIVKQVADGDLRVHMDTKLGKRSDEVGILANRFGQMIESLQQMVSNISSNVQSTAAASEELTASSEEVSAAAEKTKVKLKTLPAVLKN